MSYFTSLPENAGVLQILRLNPAAGEALIALHTAALRNKSSLAPADKELIAAYVSGLNACQFCYGVHSRTAAAFGFDESLLTALLHDVDTAPVQDALKPMLKYARKLTLEPARVTEKDARAVFEAGWDEQAVHEAVLTVCIFNFMNRLLEGHGVKGDDERFRVRGAALRDEGYTPLLSALRATQ